MGAALSSQHKRADKHVNGISTVQDAHFGQGCSRSIERGIGEAWDFGEPQRPIFVARSIVVGDR